MSPKTTDHNMDAEYLPLNFELKNIYALGLTYKDHLKEVGEKPGNPVVFSKNCLPTVSEHSEVSIPSAAMMLNAIENLDGSRAQWLREKFNSMPGLLDYEVEVALIMLEDLSLSQLNDSTYRPQIAYVLTNDLSARSVQISGEGAVDKLRYWSASKSFPGFLPVADHIWVPCDPDLDSFPEFLIETYVNGYKRQSASTSQILYSPRQILRMAIESSTKGRLSKYDMILTGTPSGIGLSIPTWKRRLASCLPHQLRILSALRSNKNNPRLLKQGDVVTICGGELGKHTTRIV